MPKVTIDGRTVEVPAGTNLIEAGLKVGVQIPHYCYHPRLSVVGQCRMCVVKVDGIPKLQTACSTQVVKDGMVVHVEHPEVKAAQEGVMEFLLIDQPTRLPDLRSGGRVRLAGLLLQARPGVLSLRLRGQAGLFRQGTDPPRPTCC